MAQTTSDAFGDPPTVNAQRILLLAQGLADESMQGFALEERFHKAFLMHFLCLCDQHESGDIQHPAALVKMAYKHAVYAYNHSMSPKHLVMRQFTNLSVKQHPILDIDVLLRQQAFTLDFQDAKENMESITHSMYLHFRGRLQFTHDQHVDLANLFDGVLSSILAGHDDGEAEESESENQDDDDEVEKERSVDEVNDGDDKGIVHRDSQPVEEGERNYDASQLKRQRD